MANFLKFRKNIATKILVIIIIAILLSTFFFTKKDIFKFLKEKTQSYEDILLSPLSFFVSNKCYLEINKLKKRKKIFFTENKKKDIKKKIKKIFFLVLQIKSTVYNKDRYNFIIKKQNNFIFFQKNKQCISIPFRNIYNKINNILEKHFIINDIRTKIINTFFFKKIICKNCFYNPYSIEFFFYVKRKNIPKKKGKEIIIKRKIQTLSYSYKKIRKKNYVFFLGYFFIIIIISILFILYLFYFQNKIFKNNREINFLISNILLISVITIIILKYNYKILYIIPFCILPISIRSFFNFHLSIIVHIITILLLSIITPNSFEFTFIQIITGFLVLLTNNNIYKMETLLISVIKITFTYIVTFISLTLIREESLEKISLHTFYLFFFSGILTLLFVRPLIFIFEKLLNITSDISLLELSDTNTPILRLLSKKAPGTLQHVLTVATIAEEAAVAIGANSLLVKIGAIYHDIGKIKNSKFFIENQHDIINPHEKLSPKESAKIILEHVSIGIKLAKKYHLPISITDFIRTHHGNSLVHYFYEKQKEKCESIKKIDQKQFQYSGPKPFSKETAIVMIADSIEAASKSIKNPSTKDLENLVEKIINKQKIENQFSNTDITLKEIEKIKQVIKKKLISIYHTRIEYPNHG
ncbi:HD family phosphohydrolase [Blattabacterium cuenoti]|uniref:HD family phosphohydrolase n=1 Tax=Blattabacterium cuenoti TaxID=1653831 RepID=UPI00163D03FA|nr:HDIG domain-containing metalloprotein [Blattabacterium cuenoti]